jgi:hypothetical protein
VLPTNQQIRNGGNAPRMSYIRLPNKRVTNDLSRRLWRLSLCTKPLFSMSTNRQAIPSQRYIPPSQRRINAVLVPMETYKENLMGSNELSMKRGESPRSSTYASRHLERRKITTPLGASQKHHRRHSVVLVYYNERLNTLDWGKYF